MGGGFESGHLGLPGAVNSGLFVKTLAVIIITFELLAPNIALCFCYSITTFLVVSVSDSSNFMNACTLMLTTHILFIFYVIRLMLLLQIKC